MGKKRIDVIKKIDDAKIRKVNIISSFRNSPIHHRYNFIGHLLQKKERSLEKIDGACIIVRSQAFYVHL